MQHAVLYCPSFDVHGFNSLAFQLNMPVSKFEEIKSPEGPFKKLLHPDAETHLDVKLKH